jgi:hypothetical protein
VIFPGFTPDGDKAQAPPTVDDTLAFIEMHDPRVEPAIDTIDVTLARWRHQTLVAQPDAVDVLLDIRNLLTMGDA